MKEKTYVFFEMSIFNINLVMFLFAGILWPSTDKQCSEVQFAFLIIEIGQWFVAHDLEACVERRHRNVYKSMY